MTVNIHHAKTHLSALLQKVEHGQTILIARNGKPVAYLTAAAPKPRARKGGFAKGEFKVPDSFFEPLPDEVLKGFTQ